jgi:hypothetical protein
MARAPEFPVFLKKSRLKVTMAMWTILEYAMSALRSVCVIVINLHKAPPTIDASIIAQISQWNALSQVAESEVEDYS